MEPKNAPAAAAWKIEEVDFVVNHVPTATIAALLDLKERRVRQLAVAGIIPRHGSGEYEIAPCVRGYIRYLRERAMEGDPTGANHVGASRAKLLKAKARLATLEARKFEDQLLRRADVDKAWAAIGAVMRSRLMKIPEAAANAIIFLSTAAQVAGLLTIAISEALDDISKTPVDVGVDDGADTGAEGGADDSEGK